MSDATAGFGTLLKIGDGAGTESFTTVAEVLDVDGPSKTMSTAEVTNQSSANGYSEHIGTILHGGEVTFDVNWQPAAATHGATGLNNDMDNKTLRNFQLVHTDAGTTTWSFAALITALSPTSPVDGASVASITLLISGKPVLA